MPAALPRLPWCLLMIALAGACGDAPGTDLAPDAGTAPDTDASTAPDTDASTDPGTDAGTAVVDAAPDAPIDELGPWLGSSLSAVGQCRTVETFPYSCYPGTPGRDYNGCCVGTYGPTTETSGLGFSLVALADGRHELTTTACSLSILAGGAPTANCAITATATEAQPGGPLRDEDASLKSTNFLPYVGPLSTSVSEGTLTIGHVGVSAGSPQRCGTSSIVKTCTWVAP